MAEFPISARLGLGSISRMLKVGDANVASTAHSAHLPLPKRREILRSKQAAHWKEK